VRLVAIPAKRPGVPCDNVWLCMACCFRHH
jgi:hypothetical protein